MGYFMLFVNIHYLTCIGNIQDPSSDGKCTSLRHLTMSL